MEKARKEFKNNFVLDEQYVFLSKIKQGMEQIEDKLILIVDDNRDLIRVLGKELKIAFPTYTVIIATNGELACKIATSQQPNLIVMDWEMPIMNGLEATRLLSKQENTKDIPVIMATGRMTSSEDLQHALEAGAMDYVRKPIDFVELSARMNTVFRIVEQQKTIKQLMQKEIDLKSRQLTSTSMLVVEQNSSLQSYHRRLSSIEKELKNELENHNNQVFQTGVKDIIKLKRTLQEQLELDTSWFTFKTHFEDVHPNFFKKLSDIYGKLSSKDLKLCAYFRLGMEVKEIAYLLNVTPGSVRTAIYRLKKKVALTEEENFREHISKL